MDRCLVKLVIMCCDKSPGPLSSASLWIISTFSSSPFSSFSSYSSFTYSFASSSSSYEALTAGCIWHFALPLSVGSRDEVLPKTSSNTLLSSTNASVFGLKKKIKERSLKWYSFRYLYNYFVLCIFYYSIYFQNMKLRVVVYLRLFYIHII